MTQQPTMDSPPPVLGVEETDDAKSRARQLFKGFKDRESRESASVSDRYLKGHIHLVLRRIGCAERDYGILVKAGPDMGELQPGTVGLRRNNNGIWHDAGGEQPLVLPRNIQCVHIEQVVVPSCPRAEIFDGGDFSLSKPSYLFTSPVLGIKKILPALGYGEIDIFWRRSAVSLGKSNGEQVEAASNGMENDPGFGIDESRYLAHVAEAKQLLSCLRIDVGDNSIRAAISPSGDFSFQRWEVGYGPLYDSLSV